MTDHTVAVAAMVFGGVSAITAIVAVIYAHLANNKSSRANQIATDAKKLAGDANDIAARGEAREVEQHDARWEGDWDPSRPGRYLLRKRGTAEARNVRATVRYQGYGNDDEQTLTQDSMTEDGETLAFWFEGALADYQDEYAERQQRDYEASRGFQGFPHVPSIAANVMRTYPVDERVEWLTPLGSPKVHQHRNLTTFSKYFKRR